MGLLGIMFEKKRDNSKEMTVMVSSSHKENRRRTANSDGDDQRAVVPPGRAGASAWRGTAAWSASVDKDGSGAFAVTSPFHGPGLGDRWALAVFPTNKVTVTGAS